MFTPYPLDDSADSFNLLMKQGVMPCLIISMSFVTYVIHKAWMYFGHTTKLGCTAGIVLKGSLHVYKLFLCTMMLSLLHALLDLFTLQALFMETSTSRTSSSMNR